MAECPFSGKSAQNSQKCPFTSRSSMASVSPLLSASHGNDAFTGNSATVSSSGIPAEEERILERHRDGDSAIENSGALQDSHVTENSATVSGSGSPEGEAEIMSETKRVSDAASQNSGSFQESEVKDMMDSRDEENVSNTKARCPFGYDSPSFKLGPLSCVLCKALLFDTCRCAPCQHIFCRVCISRFRDCPLCGADIESIEADASLQAMVDRYIEGHGRIQRSIPPPASQIGANQEENQQPIKVKEDVSLDRGSFLLQQAVRAFQAGNLVSAKSRLMICLSDARTELHGKQVPSRELVCQLGAILGLLGDCCRAMGDSVEASCHFSESADLLINVEDKDLEVVHALSVSLNKLGDLCYYSGNLLKTREFYVKALEVRQAALQNHKLESTPSLVLDVAVSLAKLGDIERSLGHNKEAAEGFRKAAHMAHSVLPLDDILKSRKHSTITFIEAQM